MDKEWLIEDEPKNNKKKTIISSIFVVALLAIVVGISVALFRTNTTSGDNTLNTGRISMSYTEPSNALILENALPMTDEEGKAQTKYFEFTVATHATTNANDDTGITIPYEINISDLTTDSGMTTLSKSFVKVNLVKVEGTAETEVAAPTLLSNMMASTLREGATRVYKTSDTHKNNSATKTTTYRLRAWIDKSFDASTETTYQYKFSVNVNSQVNAVGVEYPEEPTMLRTAILGDNNANVVSSGDGLYVSTETNDGRPTYYYRGAVENNYVQFAEKEGTGYCKLKDEYANSNWSGSDFSSIRTKEECLTTNLCTQYAAPMYGSSCTPDSNDFTENALMWESASSKFWKVIRINEDGSIRLILNQDIAANDDYTSTGYYYSDSYARDVVENWYTTNLSGYDEYIVASNYCESYKATNGLDTYQADFKCPVDSNSKQYVTAKVGLISLDEALMSGSNSNDNNTYLKGLSGNTLSRAPEYSDDESGMYWYNGYKLENDGKVDIYNSSWTHDNPYNPVINLRGNVTVTGSGTSGDPWVVQ